MSGQASRHFFILQLLKRNLLMPEINDTYRHKGLRKKLIDQLRELKISDEQVLDAMMQIPRHLFLEQALELHAYENKAFPILAGQTISQPYTVAYQTQLLQIKPFESVLEIGTGSMYQAYVLAAMKARVFTIERQKSLYDRTMNFPLRAFYPNIKFFFGDGFEGLPTFAPFDKIIITAAAPIIPPRLLDQLKPGGWMVIPVNESDAAAQQRMLRITREPDGSFREEAFENFSFVPMLTGKNH